MSDLIDRLFVSSVFERGCMREIRIFVYTNEIVKMFWNEGGSRKINRRKRMHFATESDSIKENYLQEVFT